MATIQGFIFPDLPTLSPICSAWGSYNASRDTIDSVPALGGAFRNHLFNGMEAYDNDPLEGISPAEALLGASEYHAMMLDMLNTLGDGSGGGTSNLGMSGWFWFLAENTGWLGGAKDPESCDRNRSTNMLQHAYTNTSRAFYRSELELSAGFGQVILDIQADSTTLADAEEEISDLNNQSTANYVATNKAKGDLQGANFARYVEVATIGGAILILAYTGYKTLKNK